MTTTDVMLMLSTPAEDTVSSNMQTHTSQVFFLFPVPCFTLFPIYVYVDYLISYLISASRK